MSPQVRRTGRRRLPAYVALPIYLAAVGVALRYAVHVGHSGNWDFLGYLRALCVYDCNAYERLALSGYDGRPSNFDKGDANNWAFFPLYSILVGAASRLTGLSVLAAGSALSVLLTIWTAIAAWPLVEEKFRAYVLFCAFLFLGPFSYYFTTLYTEPLFMLFTVVGFGFLRQRDYVTAGLTGALMTATRSTGLAFAAAMLVAALQHHLADGGSWRGFLTSLWRRTDLLLGLALVPVGLCLFALYLYFHSGDALAFAHIQRAWGRSFANPFHNLWLTIELQFKNGNWRTISHDLAFGIAAVAGLALVMVMALRRRWDWAIFCLLGIVLPLSTNAYSMPRFVVGLAPAVITAAQLVARPRWLFWLILAALALLDVLLLRAWTARSYYLM